MLCKRGWVREGRAEPPSPEELVPCFRATCCMRTISCWTPSLCICCIARQRVSTKWCTIFLLCTRSGAHCFLLGCLMVHLLHSAAACHVGTNWCNHCNHTMSCCAPSLSVCCIAQICVGLEPMNIAKRCCCICTVSCWAASLCICCGWCQNKSCAAGFSPRCAVAALQQLSECTQTQYNTWLLQRQALPDNDKVRLQYSRDEQQRSTMELTLDKVLLVCKLVHASSWLQCLISCKVAACIAAKSVLVSFQTSHDN